MSLATANQIDFELNKYISEADYNWLSPDQKRELLAVSLDAALGDGDFTKLKQLVEEFRK